MSCFEGSTRRPVRLAVGYVLKRFPRLSETFILNEMLALERLGVEIVVFSLKRPLDEVRNPQLERLKARIIYLPDLGTGACRDVDAAGWASLLARLVPGKSAVERQVLLSNGYAIGELARRFGLQHLHAHFASDATTGALVAAREAGLGFSFTAHARDIYHCYVSPDVDDEARRLKITAARFVTTVSDYNRRHLKRLAGRGAPVVTLYNGIDLDRFPFTAHEMRDPRKILAVGRLVEKKGFSDLVDACRRLNGDGVEFTCDVIGDGELRGALAAQITEAGLDARVRLLGAMSPDAVIDHMRRASIMVLPCKISESGDRDGLPTVLLESLAVGLPSISTRVAGIPEIITHCTSGLLVAPGAPGEIASAAHCLLGDGDMRERLASAGRRHAERNFDLSTNAASLRRLFASVTVPREINDGERHAHRVSVS